MKYFALALCFVLTGCDGGLTKAQPDGSSKQTQPNNSKYGSDLYTLLCLNGVEYMRFGSSSPTPKYNLDGTLVPCEFK